MFLKEKMMMPHGNKLVFSLAGEYFGIDTDEMDGVVEAERFFPVPMAHPVIKGVINHGWDIVIVAEPAVLFGLEAIDELPFRAAIIRDGDTMLGLSIGIKDVHLIFEEGIKIVDMNPEDKYFKAVITDGNGRRIKMLNPKAVIDGIEKIIKEQNNISTLSTLNSSTH